MFEGEPIAARREDSPFIKHALQRETHTKVGTDFHEGSSNEGLALLGDKLKGVHCLCCDHG